MAEKQAGFGWDQPPGEQPAPGLPPRAAALKQRLDQLAERDIYLGTSSWKYPGWLNQIYNPTRYHSRGKFAQKTFERECLGEYATVFPTVCGDFAFYQFPSRAMWERTFAQVPDGYKFSLKIPEEITVERYPDLPRYGKRRGTSNGHFMDAELLSSQLLRPLEPYRDKLGALIFQFGTIHEGPISKAPEFASRLGHMLGELPTDRFRFGVEVRNVEFLDEPRYFNCLRDNGTAHCFNSWTRMPPIDEQMRIPGAFTADHAAARFLLKPGRTYAQAVEKFAPYEKAQEEYAQGRSALRDLIERCLNERQSLFVFVNNRFEGSAVDTIESAV